MKFTGTETIKEATEKIESQLDNLDMDIDKKEKEFEDEGVEIEEEELNAPVFCSDLKNYYSKDKVKGKDDDNYIEAIDDISEEDEDDYTIHRDDSLILCTSTEDGGFSTLEVYIFNSTTNNLYVHHDIVLSAYPLCVEWLPSYQTNYRANFAVVGTFEPDIEIWNLDSLDAMDPDIVLGDAGESSSSIIKVKGKKTKKVQNDVPYHTDAVMSINLNPNN